MLTARHIERLDELAAIVNAAGTDVVTVPGDVTSPDTASSVVEAARERFGGVDVLINAAGYDPAPLVDLTVAMWEATIGSCLTGTYLMRRVPCCRRRQGRRAAARRLGAARAGGDRQRAARLRPLPGPLRRRALACTARGRRASPAAAVGQHRDQGPAYPDVLYVEQLIAPGVINTMPAATLRAFADHGRAMRALGESTDESSRPCGAAHDVGLDLAALTDQLEQRRDGRSARPTGICWTTLQALRTQARRSRRGVIAGNIVASTVQAASRASALRRGRARYGRASHPVPPSRTRSRPGGIETYPSPRGTESGRLRLRARPPGPRSALAVEPMCRTFQPEITSRSAIRRR